MESTIRISGCNASAASTTSESRVSERIYKSSGSTPSRSALSFSWRSLSSPEMYSTFLPVHRLLQICSSSVDLPMPGAPPTRTRLPATAPPPSTRSSSPMPVENRISPSLVTSRMRLGVRLLPTGADFALPIATGFSICSSMVLNAPQPGQRPIHFRVSLPQLVQKNTVFVLAMLFLLMAFSFCHYSRKIKCGQVFDRYILTEDAITQQIFF